MVGGLFELLVLLALGRTVSELWIQIILPVQSFKKHVHKI